MTDEQQHRQQKESDQLRQRRENFEELQRLGVTAYPHAFTRTNTIAELVEAHEPKTGEELEATRIETTTAGRVLAIRSFGKANFLVISDGAAKIQVYVRKDALSERDFAIFKLLDFGDFVGVKGHLFRTKTNELTIWASAVEFLAKCFIPMPEKWHGLPGHRDPLPAALPGPDRQPGLPARVRGAEPGAERHPGVPERPRLPRGRDADDAADCRRRAGAAVRDASQHARHAALPAHRARAVPEAAGGRRHGAGLRDQPQLQKRRDLDPAQPRVHHAGVLPGLQRVPRADGHDRADAGGRRAGSDRHRSDHVRRAPDLARAAVPPRLAARGRARERVGEARARR